MWKSFKCRLVGEHDYALGRGPREMFLECRRCGHRSTGWTLPEERFKRGDSGFRLFMAEPGDGNGVYLRTNGNGSTTTATPTKKGDLRLTLAPPR
jgi:hypothetical protein